MKTRIALHARRWMLACLLAVATTACVGNVSGQLALPEANVRAGTYYVQRQPKDERNLAETIAQAMRARGMQATAGEEAQRPTNADYIVSYVDRWMWDMRMYLMDLRIEVRDAKDMSVLGYGQSMQSSLKAMGQTHEDIVNKALDQLFKR